MLDKQTDQEYYADANYYAGVTVDSYKAKSIDYIDPAPKPFIVQIPLVEYFERMTRWKADPWQIDLGNRLQEAAVTRHVKGVREIYHAEPQIGKTIWISQHLPAWLFGHDPLFRFALAMYNTMQSEKHSKVVIRILSSALHKDIFPNKDGWLYQDTGQRERPVQAAVSGWYTNAGRGNDKNPGNAGQFSFNPVGLVSGLTGSGFDWLVGDDPYRSEKDAFSPTVNESIRDFLDFLESRINLHSNLSLMFHRYAYDDAAAFCLDKGDFDYIRYATECDGDYLHENTGQRFTDPLNRQIGEFISPRRGADYYAKVRKNARVWSSMNQGRPVAEGSEFFIINKIKISPPSVALERRAECTVMVRAWDLAATEKGGDYSVAPLIGMSPDARTTFFEMVRKQVESAGRDALMLATAKRDGFDVVVSVPIDPGAAGQTAFFHIQQLLKGYQVVGRPTTGSKEDRARPYASAVNSGDVEFISDENLSDDNKWIDATKKEMREFLLSALAHDDTIDSGADGYNECFERVSKGLVIKSFSLFDNLQLWTIFAEKFGTQIPKHWTTYAALKITPDASTPNSAVIVTHAAQNSGLVDNLFLVGEYKEYTSNYLRLFDWMDAALKAKCLGEQQATIWLHPDSEQYQTTLRQKLKRTTRLFDGNEIDGLTELNWYIGEGKLKGLVEDPTQAAVATDSRGLFAYRQEAMTWGYDKNSQPTKVGAVLDCLRIVTHRFHTRAKPLTFAEKVNNALSPEYQPERLAELSGTQRENAHYGYVTERAKIESKFKKQENRHSRNVFDSLEWK